MNNYTAFEGKIIIGFSKEQVDSHDIKAGLKIVKQKNPSDYSLERAKVMAVNAHQTFFKPGDDVLVHYIVFTDGRSNMVTSPSRMLWRTEKDGREHQAEYESFKEWFPNGHEAYWALDGTDQGSRQNQSDIYARLHLDERGILTSMDMLPGYVAVTGPPPVPEKIGRIIVPDSVRAEQLEGKTGVRTITHISDYDSRQHGLKVGDEVYMQTEFIFGVQSDVGNFWIARPVYFIYAKSKSPNHPPRFQHGA